MPSRQRARPLGRPLLRQPHSWACSSKRARRLQPAARMARQLRPAHLAARRLAQQTLPLQLHAGCQPLDSVSRVLLRSRQPLLSLRDCLIRRRLLRAAQRRAAARAAWRTSRSAQIRGHDNSNAQPPQQGASFGDALAGLPGLLRAVSLGGVFKTAPFSVLGSSSSGDNTAVSRSNSGSGNSMTGVPGAARRAAGAQAGSR